MIERSRKVTGRPWLGLALALLALAGCSSGAQEGGASGGKVGSGGATVSGSGGAGSGGSTAGSGGAPGSGGASASGGAPGSGGASASGGAPGSGGASASGGGPGSGGGGSAASGGSTGSGGSNGSGGSATGGGTVAGGRSGSAGAPGGGSGGSGGGSGSGGAMGGSKKHAFLLLGQSNMAGYPKAQASDKIENSRIQVLGFDDCAATGRKKDQWAVAVPPLHECFAGAIGPGDWFSKTLIDTLPAGDTILLVPCAVSGMSIDYFAKGMAPYDTIIRRAKAAQQMGGVIEALLFHQGESDTGKSDWPGKVKTFVTNLRTDLSLGDVPFLAGELARSGKSSSHNPLVNMLPSLITKAYVISSEGLQLDPADTQYMLHFDHDSQVTFGKRYEAKFVEVAGP